MELLKNLNSNLPLASIGLLSYNQENYIEESLMSVLNQDYPNLEVIISDDCSSDNTYKIINKIVSAYRGPHKIVCHQNETNLGIGGNRTKAISLASGLLIVSADGDDISVKNRVTSLVDHWLKNSCEPLMITTDAYEIDQFGKLIKRKTCSDFDSINSIEGYFRTEQILWGATNLYHKEIFNIFGPLENGVGAEDRAMLFRSLLIGKVCSLHEALVYHRNNGIGGIKPSTAEEKRKRLVKDNPKRIADIMQMIRDAKLFNQEQVAWRFLTKKYREAEFIQMISISNSLSSAIKTTLTFKNLSLFKKVRYLFLFHTKFHDLIFFIKNKISHFKKRFQ